MLTKAEYTDAVVAAQALLQQESPGLLIDGKWGDYTNGAYNRVSPTLKNKVDAIVQVLTKGGTVSGLYIYRQAEKAAMPTPRAAENGTAVDAAARAAELAHNAKPKRITGRYVTLSDMVPHVQAASVATGIPTKTLFQFLDIEAARIRKDGVTLYDTKGINSGGYRGLYQFDKRGEAWANAAKKVKLPAFNAGWSDPAASTMAAAGYILYNSEKIREKGYSGPITGAIAYLMHNQGAGGAYKTLTGLRKIDASQSEKAQQLAKLAIKEASVA